MVMLLILGFALSSSLDNLGVGITYGIRGIRIGKRSNLIIAAICFLFSIAGIYFGQWISKVLPGILPVVLGAVILFIIGIRIILLAWPRNKASMEQENEPIAKSKGIKGILKNPESVDFDRSNEIGLGEAFILGIALSANALTNGLSAGLLGLSPLAISLTAAVGSFVTVWFGVHLGRKVSGLRIGSFTLGQFSTLLSGVILLLIAANNFL